MGGEGVASSSLRDFFLYASMFGAFGMFVVNFFPLVDLNAWQRRRLYLIVNGGLSFLFGFCLGMGLLEGFLACSAWLFALFAGLLVGSASTGGFWLQIVRLHRWREHRRAKIRDRQKEDTESG